MSGKFEIFKDKRGEFRFRLKASNGQTILASEGYKQHSGCDNGIESVKKNAADDNQFDRKTANNGKFCFSLVAKNKQIIGTSEMYDTEESRDNGIESVKKNAPDASIDDQS
ncbi:MAG: YegP family protein [Gammaproteobacteria bacterium]